MLIGRAQRTESYRRCWPPAHAEGQPLIRQAKRRLNRGCGGPDDKPFFPVRLLPCARPSGGGSARSQRPWGHRGVRRSECGHRATPFVVTVFLRGGQTAGVVRQGPRHLPRSWPRPPPDASPTHTLKRRRSCLTGLVAALLGLLVSVFLQSICGQHPVTVSSYAQFWFRCPAEPRLLARDGDYRTVAPA